MMRLGSRYCVTRGPEGPCGATGPTGPAGPPGLLSTATLTFRAPLVKSGDVVSLDDDTYVTTNTVQTVLGTKSFAQMNIGTDAGSYCLTSLFVTNTMNADTATQIVPSDVLTWGDGSVGYVEAIVCARCSGVTTPSCYKVTCVLGINGAVLDFVSTNLLAPAEPFHINFAYGSSPKPSDRTQSLFLTAMTTTAGVKDVRYSVSVTYTRARLTFSGL
jgi:hypothetical protein